MEINQIFLKENENLNFKQLKKNVSKESQILPCHAGLHCDSLSEAGGTRRARHDITVCSSGQDRTGQDRTTYLMDIVRLQLGQLPRPAASEGLLLTNDISSSGRHVCVSSPGTLVSS